MQAIRNWNIEEMDSPAYGYDEITIKMEEFYDEAVAYLLDNKLYGKLFLSALLDRKADFEKAYRSYASL
jgi:GTP-binding protein EngB required for normal cell division